MESLPRTNHIHPVYGCQRFAYSLGEMESLPRTNHIHPAYGCQRVAYSLDEMGKRCPDGVFWDMGIIRGVVVVVVVLMVVLLCRGGGVGVGVVVSWEEVGGCFVF